LSAIARGKPKKLPGECGAVKGANNRASESSSVAQQQDASADRHPRSPTRSIPALPHGRGIARAVAKALGASSNALWHEGRRRASVRRGPRAPPGRVTLKSTLGSERTANAEIVDGRARASHRSDWVLVRGGRSVEVDGTRLSCRFGARARASNGRTIAADWQVFRFRRASASGFTGSARRARIRARTSGLLVTGRGRLFHARRALCKRV
jgi:hypothetical protein